MLVGALPLQRAKSLPPQAPNGRNDRSPQHVEKTGVELLY
jgi:hypothetical protein